MKSDQQTGAIKAVLMSPLSPAALVACAAAYPVARSAASACAFLVVGACFGATLGRAHVLAVLVAGTAALGAFAALGLLSAASTLVFKRGDPVVWLFSALSWLLGGVFFSVAILPSPLQRVASWLPIRYALDALRKTLLGGATLSDASHEIAILLGIAAAGLPLSVLIVHLGIGT